MMVCVVDDDFETRNSLQFLLEAKRIPVATFESAPEFLNNWNPLRTGCLVVDIRMPGMSGRDLQQELLLRGHNVPLIMMTGYGDVPLAVETMSRGALHFFEKPIPYLKLIEMVEIGLKKAEADQLVAQEMREFELRCELLSPQEFKVAEYVARGYKSERIAQLLKIVVGTVDLYRTRVYAKMKVSNAPEFVRMWVSKRVSTDFPDDE